MNTKKRSAAMHKLVKPRKIARPSHRKVYVAVSICVALFVVALVGWCVWFYGERALPNVAVGGVQVSNQQPAEIRQAIAAQAPELSITFDDNGKKLTIPAKDLGVVVDAEATLQNVLNARREGNVALW